MMSVGRDVRSGDVRESETAFENLVQPTALPFHHDRRAKQSKRSVDDLTYPTPQRQEDCMRYQTFARCNDRYIFSHQLSHLKGT